MYPQASNFRLGGDANTPKAWWILHLVDGSRQVCQTTGWAFITLVQRTLKTELMRVTRMLNVTEVPSFDGPFDPRRIEEDGVIGPNTLRALWVWVRDQRFVDFLLDAIQQDASLRIVRRTTVIAMIMLVLQYGLAQGGERVKLSQIELPDDAILPLFGSAPVRTGQFLSVCTLLPAPAPEEPPRPPPPPPSDEVVAPPTPPVPTTTRPPGPVTLPPATRESTLSPMVVVAGVATVLVVAAVAYASTRPKQGGKRRRRSK